MFFFCDQSRSSSRAEKPDYVNCSRRPRTPHSQPRRALDAPNEPLIKHFTHFFDALRPSSFAQLPLSALCLHSPTPSFPPKRRKVPDRDPNISFVLQRIDISAIRMMRLSVSSQQSVEAKRSCAGELNHENPTRLSLNPRSDEK